VRRLRIAMVTDWFRAAVGSGESDPRQVPGAQSLTVAGLSAALTQRGHEVRVYAPDLVAAGEDFGQVLEKSWSGPDGPPDVIHAPVGPAGSAAVAAGRSANRPLVLGYQAPDCDEEPAPPLHDLASPAVAGVITSNNDDFKELVRNGVPRFKITRVPAP
jgi:hypothetical protein